MADRDQHLRASDADRERVIEQLRRHAADGRLTLDEFEDRVGEALAARTRDDLRPVMRELPQLPPDPAPTPHARRRVAAPSARTLFTVAAVTIAIVLVMQGMWWVAFPLMGVLGGCGRSGRCASGGRSRQHLDRPHGRHHRPHGQDDDERGLIHV